MEYKIDAHGRKEVGRKLGVHLIPISKSTSLCGMSLLKYRFAWTTDNPSKTSDDGYYCKKCQEKRK